ncbi:zinc finger matrin-type protein 5-like [Trichoplusia ni]|uniref:Zinc finger matrin-type protein 5-like n=1 Tax=Trichoplusia ni TaxID=7111 RepID=A0A7E5WTM7_TRINI|nr:zinc finger matrin-type protein 5-like [Trichoplusia ni]XP_026745391.1 zinc finger matrin-type protein 5-like [Trichoplusia ni]
MGKRYHCDYCDKTMVATPTIVKTHNRGMVHQKLVQEHYQQFKDPETILAEESKKKPCSRFATGTCQFGSICRFSHYTQEQLKAFQDYVAFKNKPQDVTFPSFEDLFHKFMVGKTSKPNDSDNGNTLIYDGNGVTHTLPWTYNSEYEVYGDDLPPSIKKMKLEDFAKAKIVEWG